MAFSFRRTGDSDYPRFIKAVVQGAPKSGKTTFLSTFPNVVIADVEHEQGGLMSIAHKNVPYVEIDTSHTLRTLKTILGDDSLRAKAASQLGMSTIESVAIDTLDEFQRILKKERLEKTKGKDFKRDDWGWLLEEMRAIINGFVALPLNVVFTVHTKLSVIDEDTSIMVPALQGAIGDELPGMVGFALETTKRKAIDTKGNSFTQYQLQVEGDEKSPHLGNRAGGRLPRMIEPDFAVLHKAVYEGIQIAQTQNVDFDSGDTTPVSSSDPAAAPSAPEQGASETSAQPQGEAAPAPVDTTEPPPADPPAGAPAEDDQEKISQGALKHLQGMYAEFGQVLPPSASEWTMAKGRDIARWVVSVKTDMRQGSMDKDAATEQVVEGLKGMDAWVDPESPEIAEKAPNASDYTGDVKDTVNDIMSWVGQSESRAAAALEAENAKGDKARASLQDRLKKVVPDEKKTLEEPKAEEPKPEPEKEPEPEQQPEKEPEPEPEPEPEKSEPEASEAEPESNGRTPVQSQEEEAALIKEELDGERIPDDELPVAERPCEECGKPTDDPELSELAVARYGKFLCVDDYLKENAARKKAATTSA